MALELEWVKLFSIAILVFDFTIVVDGIVCFDFPFVEFSVGKTFANDGSNWEHCWCVGACGVESASA